MYGIYINRVSENTKGFKYKRYRSPTTYTMYIMYPPHNHPLICWLPLKYFTINTHGSENNTNIYLEIHKHTHIYIYINIT